MISNKKLLGSWKNSKVSTKGITSFDLEGNENSMTLIIHRADDGVFPKSPGPIEVTMHAKDENSSDCIAFHGHTSINDYGFSFAGNINKGLIIIATYITNTNDVSKNVFIREFFYKLK